MTYAFPNMTKETASAAPGTGSFVFTGGSNVADMHQGMTAALADGEQVLYEANDGSSREVGIGTWTEGTGTLTRDTVLTSTTGSKIDFSSTAPTVIITVAGTWFDDLEDIRDLLSSDGSTYVQLNDNIKLILGTGSDAEVYYNGTDLIIDPDAVGSGVVQVSGTVRTSNAGGSALLDEAASSVNPTLIPDRADLTTGIGGDGTNLHVIRGGEEKLRFSASISSLVSIQSDAGGGFLLRNSTASASNPSICPDRQDPDTGLGQTTDHLSLIAGGHEMLGIDEGTSGTGQLVFDFNTPNYTCNGGATARFRLANFDNVTLTLSNNTQVTTANEGMMLELGTMTIEESAGAVTVDEASTLHVPAIVAGTDVTITSNKLISTDVDGCYLTSEGVWHVNGLTVSTDDSFDVDGDTPQLTIRDTATSSSGGGGHLRLASNDGAAVADGHRLGQISFRGSYNGSGDESNGAHIRGFAGENWSSGNYGAYIEFWTTADGGGSPTRRLKIQENGYTRTYERFIGDDTNAFACLDEAASSTNPTLCPDRQDLTTGIGGNGAGDLNLIASGTNVLKVEPSLVTFVQDVIGTNASSFFLDKNNASSSNPTLCPNRQDQNTGLSGGGSDDLWIVCGGATVAEFTSAGLYLDNANGPALQNETASSTNPTLIPDKTDVTSGIGSNGTNLYIIVGTVAAITVEADQEVSFAKSVQFDEAAHFGTPITHSPSSGTPNTQTIDLDDANHQILDLTSTTDDLNLTLNATANRIKAGTIEIRQHATTPRDITFIAGTNITLGRWLGTEPTWSSQSTNDRLIVSWMYNGTDVYLSATEVQSATF